MPDKRIGSPTEVHPLAGAPPAGPRLPWSRREFVGWTTGLAAGGLALPASLIRRAEGEENGNLAAGKAVSEAAVAGAGPRADYRGPNVILIRFGGGCRRREAIDPQSTSYAPYLLNELIPRGTLFEKMQIGPDAKDTGHGQGTLNILVGRYDEYSDVSKQFLGERFEAQGPTLFEYLRAQYNVPMHESLIINGEDRTQEEFYTFSNHHLFGVNYRSSVLSLYRFKTYLKRRRIEEQSANWSPEELAKNQAELKELEQLDARQVGEPEQGPELRAFWADWRKFYGDTGLLNPRGDSLLTELAVRAMSRLTPRLMMVNYNDCDYVHWGNIYHYHRAITIMDEGIRRIVETARQLPQYQDNTVFVVVPDCGRDDARLAAVPCQHHFNSKSSREIFALAFGKGIRAGVRVDKLTEQQDIAPTVAQLMGFSDALVRKGDHQVQGRVLEEALV